MPQNDMRLPEPSSTIFPTSAKWSRTSCPDTSQAARTALVDLCVLFVTVPFSSGPTRSLVLDRLKAVLPHLDGIADGPFYELRIAADRLLTACRDGGHVLSAERGLESALRSMFAERSDASIARVTSQSAKKF
jgi:hypothetical protein